MAEKFLLQVTAGSSYDHTNHQIVPVNCPKPISIESESISVHLNVRIQSFCGLPLSSPSTSPYFFLTPHAENRDQYSISFAFSLKSTINGNDLIFGNDFDHSIRDRLPPGFNTAFRIVKWFIDPGLDGDVYCDQPYLYGPTASSLNTLYVGSKHQKVLGRDTENDGTGLIFTEGGSDEGSILRQEKGVPDGEATRRKYFLNQTNRKNWEWEAGREYGCDFFNPYLDFNGTNTWVNIGKVLANICSVCVTTSRVYIANHEILGWSSSKYLKRERGPKITWNPKTKTLTQLKIYFEEPCHEYRAIRCRLYSILEGRC